MEGAAEIPRYYVLVRKDLDLTTQMVQVCHACRIAGARFTLPLYAHLILLQVDDETHFDTARDHIRANGIQCVSFSEPDGLVGSTAICTEPVYADKRSTFNRYKLWAP
jgi:hypothetical protein